MSKFINLGNLLGGSKKQLTFSSSLIFLALGLLIMATLLLLFLMMFDSTSGVSSNSCLIWLNCNSDRDCPGMGGILMAREMSSWDDGSAFCPSET